MTKRKPPAREVDRQAIAEARERHLKRPLNPGVVVEQKGDTYRLAAPHRDGEGWQDAILDAFGTRSRSVARVFLDHLAGVCRREDDGVAWTPNEVDLNAVLAIVAGTRPKSELQAALAAQMAGVHLMTMRLMGAACAVEGWIDPVKAGLVAKLAQTFARQSDTMARLQGRVGKQSIKVKYERHEHRHVHVGRPGEGGGEIPRQAHALACAEPTVQPRDCIPVAELAPVRGDDTSGLAMPRTGRAG